MTEELIAVTYRGKAVRFVPCGGRIEQILRDNRFYEAEMLHYLEALALRGAYVDVGGWVGTHALFFAAHCPSTEVHTFEPRAHCCDELRRNVEASGLGDRVRIHQVGVSDRAETATARLDRKVVQFSCRPLDEMIDGPVAVLKIDVEGMELKVLAGADRILRESKPLVLIESHTSEELARNAAFLERYGYRPTGRVFNDSPTYELAADDSPLAPVARLPRVHGLLSADLWLPDGPAELDWSGGRLRVAGEWPVGQAIHLTQPGLRLRHPPEPDLLEGAHPATVFVQATGHRTEGMNVELMTLEYDDVQRTVVSPQWFGPRYFRQLDLAPGTRRLRLALRLSGAGELVLDRLALHVPVPAEP